MSSNISFHTRRKLLVQSRQIKELSRRFGEGGGGSFDAEETEAEPRSSISRRRALVMGSAAVTRLPSGRRKSLLIMRVTRDADPVLAAGELRLWLGGGGRARLLQLSGDGGQKSEVLLAQRCTQGRRGSLVYVCPSSTHLPPPHPRSGTGGDGDRSLWDAAAPLQN